MKIRAFAFGCIVLLVPAAGQAQMNGKVSSQTIQTRLPDYKLQAGDVITIRAFQEQNLDLNAVKIDAAGNVALPAIGTTVHVAGLSAAETRDAVQQAYEQAHAFKNPNAPESGKRVAVMVDEYHRRSALDVRGAEPGRR